MENKQQEILKNLQTGIDKITNKEQQVVFYVQDTKGNAKASIATMYLHAKTLKDAGYNAVILHEKEDYMKVGSWMGMEYDELPHFSIEKNQLKIGPADFIIIPEVLGNVAEQIERLPMEKIMLVQQYENMLDPFAVGKSWISYGVHETITTSETLKEAIESTIRVNNVTVIPIAIEDYYTPSEEPKKPLVAIHCRDVKKAAKLIKQFYLKYPLLKFISFKDMHNMTQKDFATNLKECALAVWYDDDSSFGTFPVEAMKCNVPVIGKAPTIIPEWMTDDNGIWVYDENQMVDLVFNFMKGWLEDNLPENYQNVTATVDGKYTAAAAKEAILSVYPAYFEKRITKLERLKEKVITTPE